MRRLTFWVLIFGLAAVLANAQVRAEQPRDIILIGWDGAQRNHVNECLERGELLNLKKLASEGIMVNIDISEKTETKPGWAQILTGYKAEVTGVYSNWRYQPIPKGYTIFERLRKSFGPENIVTVAVVGKKGNVDCDPPQLIPVDEEGLKKQKKRYPEAEIVDKDGKKYLSVPGKPYYYTKDDMDLFINGIGDNDKTGAKALELLEKYKDRPFFFFVHFNDADTAGHKSGENSKEYNDTLISADAWLGNIVRKLKELNLYDKTLVYVTADHGFDEGENRHTNAPYVFLVTNDPEVMRSGDRMDIAPTILDRFGLNLDKIEPPLDGHPLTKPYNKPR